MLHMQDTHGRRNGKDPADGKEMINPAGNDGEKQSKYTMCLFEALGELLLICQQPDCAAVVCEPLDYLQALVNRKHAWDFKFDNLGDNKIGLIARIQLERRLGGILKRT
jgi:hypothetical protein